MNTHIQDKIDNYLLNRMSDEDKAAFEAEMEADEELKKQYQFTKVLKEELSERARLREKMAQWDKEKAEQATVRPMRRWMLAAASLAAIVVIGLFFTFNWHTMTPTHPGIGDGIRDTDDTAFIEDVNVLVKNKEYDKAINIIDAKIAENDQQIAFNEKYTDYNADMEEDEEAPTQEEAQEALKKAKDFQGELLLMKAQVLMQSGEKDKAKAILKELTDENSPVKEKAKELLKESD